MPELISEKRVTARKAHECRTCHQTAVQPGQQYKRATYKQDDSVYDWVMCVKCDAASSYVFDWAECVDYGITAEDFQEWARDTGWAADSEPEQQTPEQKAAIAYLVRRFGTTVDHAWIGVAGHADDPECTHRSDGTDLTYCGRTEHDHLWSTR